MLTVPLRPEAGGESGLISARNGPKRLQSGLLGRLFTCSTAESARFEASKPPQPGGLGATVYIATRRSRALRGAMWGFDPATCGHCEEGDDPVVIARRRSQGRHRVVAGSWAATRRSSKRC